jgi:hypothetical protein
MAVARAGKRPITNAKAIELTLAELERMGRLEAVDAAQVQVVRSLATALDDDPSNAALWRQYREALGELSADDAHSSVDDAIADLYSEVGDPPTV